MAQAKRRSGINTFSYLGVNPSEPHNFIIQERNPTVDDYEKYNLGDEWLNSSTEEVYKLVLKAANVATWSIITDGDPALTFNTDSGSAMPSGLEIEYVGGLNINSAGSVNTITLNLNTTLVGLMSITVNTLIVNSVFDFDDLSAGVVQSNSSGELFSSSGSDGEVLISSSTGAPDWNVITSTSGTLAITNGSNSIDLDISGSFIATQYDSDSGSAVPSLGILEILGGTGIVTSASGNTVTVDFGTAAVTSVVTDVGSVTPSSGVISLVGGSGVTVTASGDTVTINKLVGVSDSPYAFNAYMSTTPLNVIGNNPAYTVPFDSVFFDLNGDFDTSSYYFVAPVDGIYNFQAEVGMRKLTTSMTEAYLSFVVNSGAPTDEQFTCENIDPSQIIDPIAFTDEVTLKGNAYLVLSAADTVKIVIGLTGAASNTAGVTSDGGTNDFRSWFGGSYIGSV
jgi:hypothetical protein